MLILLLQGGNGALGFSLMIKGKKMSHVNHLETLKIDSKLTPNHNSIKRVCLPRKSRNQNCKQRNKGPC